MTVLQPEMQEELVSQSSMLPVRRSKLALIGLVCLTVLVLLGLTQTGTGVAALSLFQSPSSPVSGQAQATAAPALPGGDQPPPAVASSGLPVPTWVIAIVAAVVIIAAIVALLLVRRARR